MSKPYSPSDSGVYCLTCGTAEFSGHRGKCWKADLATMSEATATLVKYQFIADVTGSSGGDEDDGDRAALDEDFSPMVKGCTDCYRCRGITDLPGIQQCYCGAMKLEEVNCMEALEGLQEWLAANDFGPLVDQLNSLLERREDPPQPVEEEEEDEDEDDEDEETVKPAARRKA